MNWENMGYNSILRKGDNFISYNPNPTNMLGLPCYDGDGGPETALYEKSSDKFFILNGDFRKEYEEAPNWSLCMNIYNKYKGEKRSSWSTD